MPLPILNIFVQHKKCNILVQKTFCFQQNFAFRPITASPITTSPLMQSNTFKKSEHLYLEKDFEVLIGKGKFINGYPFRLIYQIETLNGENTIPVKVGISVPKKRVRSAVNRNRIKRLVRESYRLNKHALIEYARLNKVTFTLLFVFTGKPQDVDFNIFTTKINLLLQRLQSTNESN